MLLRIFQNLFRLYMGKFIKLSEKLFFDNCEVFTPVDDAEIMHFFWQISLQLLFIPSFYFFWLVITTRCKKNYNQNETTKE